MLKEKRYLRIWMNNKENKTIGDYKNEKRRSLVKIRVKIKREKYVKRENIE